MSLILEFKEFPFKMELSKTIECVAKIDASTNLGGEGKAFRPMELLSGSLASCMMIDVIHILHKQRIDFELFRIEIEGHRKDAVPSPFERIHFAITTDAQITEERLAKNIQLTLDKYCSVAATLDSSVEISYTINS